MTTKTDPGEEDVEEFVKCGVVDEFYHLEEEIGRWLFSWFDLVAAPAYVILISLSIPEGESRQNANSKYWCAAILFDMAIFEKFVVGFVVQAVQFSIPGYYLLLRLDIRK